MDGVRILIVEDDGIIAMHIQRSLKALGYSLAGTAITGEEAIDTANETSPDLVLMDIRLGGELDGIETAERILANFDIPVVYLTAYADEITVQRAKVTGPYGYVLKPFSRRDLHIAIEMALHKAKLEKELMQKDRWLGTTLKSIADALIAADAQGIVQFMNPVSQTLTGWKDKEALGKPLEDILKLVDDETGAPTQSLVPKAIRAGDSSSHPNLAVLIDRQGKETPVEESASPIRDERNNITGVVFTFRNISERIKAERALRKSEKRYRHLFDHSINGFALHEIVLDDDGNPVDYIFLEANQAFEDLTGLSASGVIGRHVTEVIPGIEDDPFIKIYGEVALTGEPVRFEQFSSPLDRYYEIAAFSPRKGQFATVFTDITERKQAEHALKRQLDELTALYTVATAGSEATGEDALIERTTQILEQTLFPDNVGVLLVDQETGELRVHPSYHGMNGGEDSLTIPPGRGIIGIVAAEGQPRRIPDVTNEPAYLKLDPRTRSKLCVPLKVGERVIGIINAESAQVDVFSEADERLLVTLAGQLATAIEKVRLFEESQRQASELSGLYQAALATSSVLDTQLLMRRLDEQVQGLLHSDSFAIALYDEHTREIEVAYAVEEGELLSEWAGLRLPLDDAGLTGWIIRNRKPLLFGDLQKDSLPVEPVHGANPARSWLGVPLVAQDTVVGALSVQSFRPHVFDEGHCRFIESLAAQAAIALENARLLDEAKRRAIHLAALHDIDVAISSSLEPQQVYTTIVERSAELLDCDIVNLFLWDEVSEEYRGLASHGTSNGNIVGRRYKKETNVIVPQLLDGQEPISISNVESELRVLPEWLETLGVHSLLAVPLLSRDQVTGFLFWVDSKFPRQWTETHVVLAQSLAAQAAIAIENARLHDETRRRLGELSALTEVSTALRDAATIDEMLPILLERSIKVIGADHGSIFLSESGTDVMVARCWYPARPELVGLSHPPGEGITGHVTATGEIYITEDLSQDPKQRFLPGEEELLGGVHSNISLPLRTQDRTIGVMHISLLEKRPFTDEEVNILTAISGMAANAIHRTMLREQTERSLKRLDALHTIDQTITSSLDLRVTFNVLLDQTLEQLDVDAAAVLLLNPHIHTLKYIAWRGFRSRSLTKDNMRLDNCLPGLAALERRVITLPDLSTQVYPLPRTDLVAGDTFKAYCAAPLIVKGQVKGVLEVFSRQDFPPDPDWGQFLETIAGQAAIAIDNVTLFEDLERSNLELTMAYDATIEGWSRALELHDLETEGHSQRVTGLSVHLARVMGVSEKEMVHVRRGSLLHDIGKMGISDRILNKPGPLTDEEWHLVRQHPVNAYELLAPIPFLRPALDIPYYHHERWDGAGYPSKLQRDQIPLAARVFAIIDVWDAISSDRPYRSAWSQEKVLTYIREQSGKHFDPQVVDAFLDLVASDDQIMKQYNHSLVP